MPEPATIIWLVLLGLALLPALLLFCLYPLTLALVGLFRRTPVDAPAADTGPPHPSVTLITVARDAEESIGAKLHNTLTLDYPRDKLEFIVFSDGSTDRTESIVDATQDPRVRLVKSEEPRGKAHGLNAAAEAARGELLVFSDVDARLETDALKKIVRPCAHPEIGGACGQRRLAETQGGLSEAQSSYIRFDSLLKKLETRVGSITSNDGKLYSVRRELFDPVPPGASDDLYCALSVVSRGRRFAFEPQALARIPTPSADHRDELQRRRRIVCGSFVSLLSHLSLFDPLAHGCYGLRLAINKGLRRLLPLSLPMVLAATAALWNLHPAFHILLGLQALFYLSALLYRCIPSGLRHAPVARPFETTFYFCVGNLGTLLGLWDFLRGRRYVTWEPRDRRSRRQTQSDRIHR